MIEYIKGLVDELTPTQVIVETNGIGYEINISLNTYTALSKGKSIKLYIYEVIREDAHLLYGFIDKHERELFMLLISVSGVGPNTARMILSSLSGYELENAIAGEHVAMLKGVKGIGAKTAQRIIVDLKDKIKLSSSSIDSGLPGSVFNSEVQEEAVSALVMLGFNQAASQKTVQKLVQDSPQLKVEEIIKAALKML